MRAALLIFAAALLTASLACSRADVTVIAPTVETVTETPRESFSEPVAVPTDEPTPIPTAAPDPTPIPDPTPVIFYDDRVAEGEVVLEIPKIDVQAPLERA